MLDERVKDGGGDSDRERGRTRERGRDHHHLGHTASDKDVANLENRVRCRALRTVLGAWDWPAVLCERHVAASEG